MVTRILYGGEVCLRLTRRAPGNAPSSIQLGKRLPKENPEREEALS
jgi:hypothetical protein